MPAIITRADSRRFTPDDSRNAYLLGLLLAQINFLISTSANSIPAFDALKSDINQLMPYLPINLCQMQKDLINLASHLGLEITPITTAAVAGAGGVH